MGTISSSDFAPLAPLDMGSRDRYHVIVWEIPDQWRPSARRVTNGGQNSPFHLFDGIGFQLAFILVVHHVET